MTDSNEFLDRTQAAEVLRISTRTLDRLGDLPKVRIGARRVIYRRVDVQRYVERRAAATLAA